MTVGRLLSAKGKLQHLSIISQYFNKKKRRRISAKYEEEEEEKLTHTQQHLSSMFPHDIMLDILSRLPVEPLMRFRSVSRSWNHLIRKNHFFIKMHLSRSQIQHVDHEKMIITDRACKDHLYSLDCNQGSCRLEQLIHHNYSRLKPIKYNYIWGICNGLICTEGKSCLYILNPSTSEYRKVPCFIGDHNNSCYSFGYNPNANDYVVVKLTDDVEDYLSAVAIYSLRNNSWKTLQQIPYQFSLTQCGLLFNGSLHWVAYSKMIPSEDDSDEENLILAYEIATETFLEVPCPNVHHKAMFVSQYQGKLCFYQEKRRDKSFDLWVMNEYRVTESWTKVFNIQKPEECYVYPISDIVLCSTREGSILMRSSLCHTEHLILYDPKHRSHVDILGIKASGTVHSYVPSIVALNFK